MMQSQIPLDLWTKYTISLFVQMLIVATSTSMAGRDGRQASSFKWLTASPASQWMDRNKLTAMKDSLTEHHTKAWLSKQS